MIKNLAFPIILLIICVISCSEKQEKTASGYYIDGFYIEGRKAIHSFYTDTIIKIDDNGTIFYDIENGVIFVDQNKTQEKVYLYSERLYD